METLQPAQQDLASNPGTVSVEATAEKELGAFFRGELAPEAPAPAPTPAAPEPSVAPQPQEATPPPAVPGAPTPAPAEGQPSVTPPSVVEDPVEKKVREIFGADPKQAAEAILATNNRAAAMANKLKDLGLDPRTLQPLPSTSLQQPVPPTVVPQVDPKAIETEINTRLDNDPAFASLVQSWVQGDNRIKQIDASESALNSEIAKINLALTIPEIQADDFKRDQYAQQLASKEQALLRTQLEKSIVEAKLERLNTSAARYTEKYRSEVQSAFQQQAEARQAEALGKLSADVAVVKAGQDRIEASLRAVSEKLERDRSR